MSELTLEVRVSNLKSVALTVLQLLAYNAQIVRITVSLRTNIDRCTIWRKQYLRQFTSFTWQRQLKCPTALIPLFFCST